MEFWGGFVVLNYLCDKEQNTKWVANAESFLSYLYDKELANTFFQNF